MVATQVQDHLKNNNLFEPFQSGVHPKHGTEKALVKITNDHLHAANSGLLSFLIYLNAHRHQYYIPSAPHGSITSSEPNWNSHPHTGLHYPVQSALKTCRLD